MSMSDARVPVLDTYQAVVSAFSDFLVVAIHTILYERNVYPRNSFLKARKYNFPVRQSRHPKVCKWIQDAVAAVEVEMLKCTISNTSLLLLSPRTSTPLERFTFSTQAFPIIPEAEQLTAFDPPFPPAGNLPSQMCATLARLSSLSSSLSPLPKNSTFTIIIELREQREAPIGTSQPWIAAQSGVQRREGELKDVGRVKTVPVRSLDEGVFNMEVWVEEAKGKEDLKN